MKGHSIIWIVFVISTMMASLLFLAPERARASTPSAVTLKLQDTPPKGDVLPRGTGIVKTTGKINCTVNGTGPVKVFLQAQSETGGANVIPYSRVFNGSGGIEETCNFTVTTRVHKGYSPIKPPEVTVTGYFIQQELQYEIPPVSQIIEIEPYYEFEVLTPPPQEIETGGFVHFSLRIINVGNSEDTYRFDYLNSKELCDKQWTRATITDKNFKEKQIKTITVSAQAPQKWTLGKNEVTPFHLRITSIKSEETSFLVRHDVYLYVREKGWYIPGFSPTFALLGIMLVALIMGKKRFSKGGPSNKLFKYPKGLYPKLSMKMR